MEGYERRDSELSGCFAFREKKNDDLDHKNTDLIFKAITPSSLPASHPTKNVLEVYARPQ